MIWKNILRQFIKWGIVLKNSNGNRKKIALKMYIISYFIVAIFTMCGGFLLVNYEYDKSMNEAVNSAKEDNRSMYIYIATMEILENDSYTEYSIATMLRQMPDNGTKKENQVLYEADYTGEKLDKAQTVMNIVMINGEKMIKVVSRCADMYLINYKGIDSIIKMRDSNYEIYKNIVIAVSFMMAIVLYIFTWYITRPLSELANAAKMISDGDYSVRIKSLSGMKSYEAELLKNTLNELAENIGCHIEKLELENTKKEEFMGNFTHELKTPMTSIIGYADLLRTYELEQSDVKEYGTYIYREARRLEKLSLNLLDMIVAEKTKFELIRIDMELFLTKLADTFSCYKQKYGIDVKITCMRGYVYAEPSLLTTLIINLTDNAAKASEQGSVVRINGTIQSGYYIITVSDNGIGIPKEEIERITEAFYMVDKSRARKKGGAGLGLALCEKIVKIHDATMKIDSEEGKGTVVRVKLKIAKSDEIKATYSEEYRNEQNN